MLDRLWLRGFMDLSIRGVARLEAVNAWEGFCKWKGFVAWAPHGSQLQGSSCSSVREEGCQEHSGQARAEALPVCSRDSLRPSCQTWLGGRAGHRGHTGTCVSQPSGADGATDQLGADETHPLSEWMSSFYRGSWLGEVVPYTGQSKTVLRRLKWL